MAFEGRPSSHDGTAFSFRIAFSEDIAASADDMRDHALDVTGGTVTAAAQVDGRADLWSFTVTPSGNENVSILLVADESCTEAGAICTTDGRRPPRRWGRRFRLSPRLRCRWPMPRRPRATTRPWTSR